eukprot:1139810-Pelagomonas_calceolata.AAC.4
MGKEQAAHLMRVPATMWVYTLLFNRYFHFADVRYYSLWSVRSLALKHSAAPAPTTTTSSSKGSSKGKIASASAAAEGIPHGDAAPPPAKALKRSSELRREVAGAAAAAAVAEVDNGGSEAAAGRQGHLSRSEGEDVGEGGSGLQGEERPGAAGGVAGVGAGEQGGSGAGYACVPVEDLCRNLFDIMGALPETLPSSGGGEAANVADLQSWCGAAEVRWGSGVGHNFQSPVVHASIQHVCVSRCRQSVRAPCCLKTVGTLMASILKLNLNFSSLEEKPLFVQLGWQATQDLLGFLGKGLAWAGAMQELKESNACGSHGGNLRQKRVRKSAEEAQNDGGPAAAGSPSTCSSLRTEGDVGKCKGSAPHVQVRNMRAHV